MVMTMTRVIRRRSGISLMSRSGCQGALLSGLPSSPLTLAWRWRFQAISFIFLRMELGGSGVLGWHGALGASGFCMVMGLFTCMTRAILQAGLLELFYQLVS